MESISAPDKTKSREVKETRLLLMIGICLAVFGIPAISTWNFGILFTLALVAIVPTLFWAFLGIITMASRESLCFKAVTPFPVPPRTIGDLAANRQFLYTVLIFLILLPSCFLDNPSEPHSGYIFIEMIEASWFSWMAFFCFRNFPPKLFLTAYGAIYGLTALIVIIDAILSGGFNFRVWGFGEDPILLALIVVPSFFSYFMYRRLMRLWHLEGTTIFLCGIASVALNICIFGGAINLPYLLTHSISR